VTKCLALTPENENALQGLEVPIERDWQARITCSQSQRPESPGFIGARVVVSVAGKTLQLVVGQMLGGGIVGDDGHQRAGSHAVEGHDHTRDGVEVFPHEFIADAEGIPGTAAEGTTHPTG
jgi:hypothetical protein